VNSRTVSTLDEGGEELVDEVPRWNVHPTEKSGRATCSSIVQFSMLEIRIGDLPGSATWVPVCRCWRVARASEDATKLATATISRHQHSLRSGSRVSSATTTGASCGT